MEQKDLEYFHELLTGMLNDAQQKGDTTLEELTDNNELFADPADRATAESDRAFTLRIRDRERKLIKKINKTIELLQTDDFGYCETCGIEIGLRRLEARPTATQCVDCKALDEIKERQIHG